MVELSTDDIDFSSHVKFANYWLRDDKVVEAAFRK